MFPSKRTLLLLAILGGALVVPFLMRSTFFFSLLIVVLLNITFAQSWNIIGGYTGMISFGHMVFFGLGAYTSAMLLTYYGLSPFITAPLGGLISMLLAAIVGVTCVRIRGFYFAIVTSSLNEVVKLIVTIMPWTGGASGIVLPVLPFGPKTTAGIFYIAMLVVTVATIATSYWITTIKFGMGLLAIREDEDAAKATGVPTDKLKLFAIIISAFFPGVAGAIYSYYMTYIDPGTVFNLALSFQAIMMTLLGGTGTITGPVLGACLFTLTSEFLRFTVIYEGLHAIFFGVLLMVIVLFVPEGIVGWVRQQFDLERVII